MSSNTANVYDFDGTIYSRDSSVEFIKFCMKQDRRLWKYLPAVIGELIKYVAGASSKKQVKTVAFKFLESVDDVEKLAVGFWMSNEQYITDWYHEKKRSSDIIISASPEFLLRPLATKLGVRQLIATKIDVHDGKVIGENCQGQEKVRRLYEYDPSLRIETMYSDSLSDAPLLERAAKGFIVTKEGKFIHYPEYVPPWTKTLLTPAFMRFLFVGGLNACLGILLSYIFALLIHNALLAFVIGYSISLIISYFLNAIITFREIHFSIGQFMRFVVSYIPNFLVLIVAVYIFSEVLRFYSLVSYILAAVIAAPVTFLLLSTYTFKKKDQNDRNL